MRRNVIKHGCATRGDCAINLAFPKRRFRNGQDGQIDEIARNQVARFRRRRHSVLCKSPDVLQQKRQRLRVAIDDVHQRAARARIA